MKVAIVIPTRGKERQNFVDFQVEMMKRQTKRPDYTFVIDHPPLNEECDITQRFRMGVEMARGTDAELITFIEDDDAYHQEFINYVSSVFLQHGKPNLLGFTTTRYYHLFARKYKIMKHPGRSSMFLTSMNAKAPVQWPEDNYPFTDLHLWKQSIENKVFITHCDLAVGIKHGIGMQGGKAHNPNWRGYDNDDPEFKWLRTKVSDAHFEFYNELIKGYEKK